MNDDEYGRILLEPLRGEPSGLPAIDVALAMRGGRRKRRWSFGGLAVIGAGLVTGGLLLVPAQHDNPKPGPVLPPDPPVPASCTVTKLDLGGLHSAEISAADRAGRWLLGAGDVKPFKYGTLLVWHDGKLVAKVRNTSPVLLPSDVNAHGTAVGSTDGASVPYVYAQGKLTRLKGGRGEAVAINDDGSIAGTVETDGRAYPVRWPSPGAEPRRLRMPADVRGIVRIRDMAADGTIVGEIDGMAYLWFADGSVRAVGVPPVAHGQGGFMPQGFQFGWVYGRTVNNGLSDIYRYEVRTGTWQAVAAGPAGEAQVATVGWSGPLTVMSLHPAIFVGRAVLPLPVDADLRAGGVDAVSIATVTDDAHVVTGTALSSIADLSKPERPLLWRCR
jgi:hypothetical protein